MRLAYIAPELGALTGTFVYREIYGLRSLGHDVVPFGTMSPKGGITSAEARPLIEECSYLYDRHWLSIVGRAATVAWRHPSRFAIAASRALWDSTFARVSKPTDRAKLLWHFAVGLAFASELEQQEVMHVHAHFAHVPTSIAMYGAIAAGISYSFTCHANDIFERGVALREKVARSAFAVCISRDGKRFLEGQGCLGSKLHVVHCSVDPTKYRRSDKARAPRGSGSIVAVGRLVEKKGFADLVEASALLRDRGVEFTVRILGDGPLRADLDAAIRERGLSQHVALLGSHPHEAVLDILAEADLFVLPCVIAASGDRDGIPVALMEAMAFGIPVVSTTVSGIPELVRHGFSGMLAAPHQSHELANSIERLLSDSEFAAELARRARETIESEFADAVSHRRLSRLFRGAAGSRSISDGAGAPNRSSVKSSDFDVALHERT